MRTTGVDLAAADARTGLAVLEWRDDGTARLLHASVGAGDDDILRASEGSAKIGIDCPLGWPVDFIDFLAAHARGDAWSGVPAGADTGAGPLTGAGLRRHLAYRETDRAVRAATGRWPLSVSTDRLGVTAIRCAELLGALGAGRDRGELDRSGSGRVVEAYPGAALRRWGIDTTGYRTDATARGRVLDELRRAAPWLEIADADAGLLAANDHALDALVAALNARASALGATMPIPPELADRARVEGWIALPTGPLAELAR